MPEGQFLGPKASYVYVSDNTTPFAILRDTELALSTQTGLEPYTQGAPFAFPLPRGLKPRGVYWLGFVGQREVRKFIICGTLDCPLYVTDSSSALTIDGIPGFTTSRQGERLRYIRRTQPAEPPA